MSLTNSISSLTGNEQQIYNIHEIAQLLNKNTKTIRQQIARGTFPIKVVLFGGTQHILRHDLECYLMTGEAQPQTAIRSRTPRNPWGRKGKPSRSTELSKKNKVGRPTKAESIARKNGGA